MLYSKDTSFIVTPDSSDSFTLREAEGWKGVESLGEFLPMRVYQIDWHFKKQSHGESVRLIGIATDTSYNTWVLTVCRPRHTEKGHPLIIQAFRKLDVPCTQNHVASSFFGGEIIFNQKEIDQIKRGKKPIFYSRIVQELITEVNQKITPFVFIHVPMTMLNQRIMMLSDE